MKLVISKTRVLKDSKDALHYCLFECPNHHLGCAVDCPIRKKFKIPPHGTKYPE